MCYIARSNAHLIIYLIVNMQDPIRKNRNEQDAIYSTNDLCLATTLVCLKFFMFGIDYQIEGVKNKPVGYFKFEDSEDLRAARQKYIQGMLLVEPRDFLQNLHTLKAEVHNMAANPHSSVY